MKIAIIMTIGLLMIVAFPGFKVDSKADTAQEIKKEAAKAARNIKDDAVQTGNAAVEIGHNIKESSKEAWSDVKEGAVKAGKSVKEGVKDIGQDFKKAYHETKDSITGTAPQQNQDKSGSEKTDGNAQQ